MYRYTSSLFSITIIGAFLSVCIADAQQIVLPPSTFTPDTTPPPVNQPPPLANASPAPNPPASTTPVPTGPLTPATPSVLPAPSVPSEPASPPLAVPPPEALLKFSGQGPFNSRPFTIPDHWEVDWDSPGPLNITLGHLDGKPDEMIGQQAGPSHGSSFQPTGGQYYLKIVGTGNWVVWMVQVGSVTTPATPAPPGPGSALTPGNPLSAPNLPIAGMPSVPTNYGDPSYYQNPIVIVRGNNAVGTGFLIKMGQATYVVTNQHVISNNPGLMLQTIKGQNLVATAVQAATDRDLAMFTIKDDGTLPTIPYATDVAGTTRVDDDTVIPGNSQGGGVVVDTPGKVVGVGPVRLEVSNPIYPGNSGSPVVDLRTKQAVGVITEAEKSDNDGFVNQASLANRNSGIQAVRYFSLRFDNVPKWEPVNMESFYQQTHFIEAFHETSMELLSFFKALRSKNLQDEANERERQYQAQYQQYQQQQQQYNPYGYGRPPQRPQVAPESSDDDEISMTQYRDNPKLSEIMDHLDDSTSTSSDDVTAKAQEAAMELNGIAESNMTTIQNPMNFYTFNKSRTTDEIELRNRIINHCKDINHQLINP